jgi:hypothetical protein
MLNKHSQDQEHQQTQTTPPWARLLRPLRPEPSPSLAPVHQGRRQLPQRGPPPLQRQHRRLITLTRKGGTLASGPQGQLLTNNWMWCLTISSSTNMLGLAPIGLLLNMISGGMAKAGTWQATMQEKDEGEAFYEAKGLAVQLVDPPDDTGQYSTTQGNVREDRKLGGWLIVWPMRAETRQVRATEVNIAIENMQTARVYSERAQDVINAEANQDDARDFGMAIAHLGARQAYKMAARSIEMTP